MKRWLREPLLHFLVLGALVFLAWNWLQGDAGGVDEIVITRGQQENLISTFQRTWRRPPTAAEFKGLLDSYLRQEIAYREAAAIELDRNDVVIRRRLQQKLEMLNDDLATLTPPTEAELQQWYETNDERFREQARYSFEQIYFSGDRRGANARSDAQAALVLLRGPAGDIDLETLGDSSLLPMAMRDAREGDVAASFGSAFVGELAILSLGEWEGPVSSAFGEHLVRIRERVASRIPPFEEVAGEALEELQSARRKAALDALYSRLAENYSIRVEPLIDETLDSVAQADSTQ